MTDQPPRLRAFDGDDLSDAVFWGVGLQRARFRDVDLSGVTVFHAQLTDVSLDGVVERLVVNGVDVTEFVNERDRWYPLRTQLRPVDRAGLRAAWDELERRWDAVVARATTLGERSFEESVDGEWSVRDTLRHLVFAFDKWFALPLLGHERFTAWGLPNTGSAHFDWPGLVPTASPGVGEILSVRASQSEAWRRYVEEADLQGLPDDIDVMENGRVPTWECFYAVLEEVFEHLRYADRDLAALERRRAAELGP